MPDTEVDQSIHIEHLRDDTILALSNTLKHTIRIPVAVKRAAVYFLHQKSKIPLSKKRIALRMFAAALYLLLKDFASRLDYVVIDTEYTGYESEIKGMVLAYLHRDRILISSSRIIFRQIGKNSRAHDLAIRTYRGELPENICVTEAAFLDVLK